MVSLHHGGFARAILFDGGFARAILFEGGFARAILFDGGFARAILLKGGFARAILFDGGFARAILFDGGFARAILFDESFARAILFDGGFVTLLGPPETLRLTLKLQPSRPRGARFPASAQEGGTPALCSHDAPPFFLTIINPPHPFLFSAGRASPWGSESNHLHNNTPPPNKDNTPPPAYRGGLSRY